MNATFTVPVIRIADFINKVVATRSLPADQPGVVVMKLDVEVPPLSNALHIVNIDLHKFALLWGEAQSCLPKGDL